MASTVVYTFAEGQTTVLTLYPDGSDTPANGAGDTGVAETNRKWLYTATIAETLSGLHRAEIAVAGQAVAEGWVNMVDGAENEVKQTRDEALGFLSKIAPRLIGTLSGAGTGTEICVYGGTTVTYTVDNDGNITNVVFS